MAVRLSIYHPAANVALGHNPFGKDVANLQLFRALARHGGFERIDVFNHAGLTPAQLQAGLLPDGPSPTNLGGVDIFDQRTAAEAGALLRGQPDLETLAWLRRRMVGDRAYSLMGLVHTIAPPAVRRYIAAAATAPVQPWDAVICTSPAVQASLKLMFDGWCDHLSARFGGSRHPLPQLPVIPLEVDGPAFAALRDRPEVRAQTRAELGLGEDDILVLWVGRLSFFEKAAPQPMLRAIEQAAAASKARVVFVQAGWFPEPDRHGPAYEDAARAYAPSVDVRVVDGNDYQDLVGRMWAAADIFLSLVDNVQETFGITPLEAMAAGVPVVASDWDGYRYTMRDGIEAFLIPTLDSACRTGGRTHGRPACARPGQLSGLCRGRGLPHRRPCRTGGPGPGPPDRRTRAPAADGRGRPRARARHVRLAGGRRALWRAGGRARPDQGLRPGVRERPQERSGGRGSLSGLRRLRDRDPRAGDKALDRRGRGQADLNRAGGLWIDAVAGAWRKSRKPARTSSR